MGTQTAQERRDAYMRRKGWQRVEGGWRRLARYIFDGTPDGSVTEEFLPDPPAPVTTMVSPLTGEIVPLPKATKRSVLAMAGMLPDTVEQPRMKQRDRTGYQFPNPIDSSEATAFVRETDGGGMVQDPQAAARYAARMRKAEAVCLQRGEPKRAAEYRRLAEWAEFWSMQKPGRIVTSRTGPRVEVAQIGGVVDE